MITIKKITPCRWWLVSLLFMVAGAQSLFSQFTPIATSSTAEIRDFLRRGQSTGAAKLVFVRASGNDKRLCYIDFSEESPMPVIHTIEAAAGAQVPVLSPDGKWVVYAVGAGAEAGSPVSQRSSVYLCRLDPQAKPILIAQDSACEPRFAYASNTLTIIYPTLAPNFAWEGFGKTMEVAIDVTNESTPVIGEKKTLYQYGSYTGGLSWDRRYLCGGGGHIAMVDISAGKMRPDTISLFSQSCNASIASSRVFTNTLMHLTLAGSHKKVNGGKQWGSWQVIILSNKNKELIRGFWHPTQFKHSFNTVPETFSGTLKWHHCEWSNHPYFATATLNADRYFKVGEEYVNTSYQERLYLVNLKDSLSIEVLRPDTIKYNKIVDDNSGIHWPWLWTGIPTGFTEDPNWLKPFIPTMLHAATPKNHRIAAPVQLSRRRLSLPDGIQAVSLYSIAGKLVWTMTTTGEEKGFLRIPAKVAPGIYRIKIRCQNDIVTTAPVCIL